MMGGGGGKQVRGQFVAIKGATYGEINGRIFGAQPTLVHKVSAVRLIRPYICVGGTFRVCDEQKQDITALDGFPQRGSSVGAVLALVVTLIASRVPAPNIPLAAPNHLIMITANVW